MGDKFATTRWTMVLAARDGDGSDSRDALAALCEAYWQPIYAFIRRQGYDADESLDLTQAYFAELLTKNYLDDVKPEAGKFRSFLLVSVKHLLSHERARERALKRGGRAQAVSLDRQSAESGYSLLPTEDNTPETLFEKQWALTLLARTMERLRETFAQDGKAEYFEALKVYLPGRENTVPYARIAEQLGTTEAGVKMAVHRLRKHFARTLRAEIAQTVRSPAEIDDELRHLRTTLAS